MKRIILKAAAVLSVLVISAAAFSGCGKTASENLIRVGVCAGPYEDMFREGIQPQLEAKDWLHYNKNHKSEFIKEI